MRGRVATVAGVLGLAAALAAPAGAFATDRFVDRDTGSDQGGASTCTSQANPCESVSQAIAVVGSNDTIKVDDSVNAYSVSAVLSGGTSLVGAEFVGGDEGEVALDGGSAPAVQVLPAQSGGTIDGLTLRSSGTAVLLNGSVTAVTNNRFDSDGGSQTDLDIQAGSPTVSGNTFSSVDTTLLDRGIVVNGASPTISGNTLNQLNIAIALGDGVQASGTRIEDNVISGIHPSVVNGSGIRISRSINVVVEDNRVLSPLTAGLNGIVVASSVLPSSVQLRRNEVYGYGTGVTFDSSTSASMNGDVIGNSELIGVAAIDTGAGGGDLTAKNVTVVGAASATEEFLVSNTDLTLDSSIVGDEGINTASTTGTCTITRSRGPVNTPGGDGCSNFQTTATPNFVAPGGNNFHLTLGNPALIDQGDPAAAVAPDDLDYDGDPREADGDESCTEVRDIGADEVLPPAPTAQIDSGPANGSTITVNTATFTASTSETCPGAGFECSLDGAAFAGCTSPIALTALSEGAHTFSVRSFDLVPQRSTPATRTFTVDLPDPPVEKPAPQPKKCKKGQKLKNGKCVKKKKRKGR